MKKLLALLAAAALTLSLAACGEPDSTGFRTLEVIGQRQYSLIFRLGDRIAPEVNAAMRQLYRTGELSSASLRWLGRDAIALSENSGSSGEESPEPAETEVPESTEELPDRTLIVGVEEEFDPMSFVDNGVLCGMSIDIASALGTALGWRVSYQPISAAEVEAQLSSGNIDVALGFDPGSVKEGSYTVGVTYMSSDIVLAARRSGINSVRDIRGERIGTVDDPAVIAAVKANEHITRYASGATVYLSSRRCVSAMDNGWCAAIAMDEIMLEYAR